MSSKQAERARARKAQKRKKILAARKSGSSSGAGFSFEPVVVLADDVLDLRPEDYLPTGQVKASAALLELAKPLVQEFDMWEGQGFAKIMDLVLVAWNLEATDGDGEEELMNELRTVIGDEFFDGAQAMITIARARKRALFPDDRRLLVNMKITDRPEGPHVQVATAIYDKP